MATTNFFKSVYKDDPVFFDEGPRVLDQRPVLGTSANTSSIDIGSIDPWRQGVEITQQKHFDAGMVKIHAGEPGHMLRRNRFGMDRNFRTEVAFEELDYFNPRNFLLSQEIDSPLNFNIITFPIITSDNDQIENYIFDGVIEPFTIKSRAAFFSIDVPFEAHEVKGAVMGGNTDSTMSSDMVLTVDYYDVRQRQVGYLDLVDMIDGRFPLNGFFNTDKAPCAPFMDERYVRNVDAPVTYDSTMTAALSMMSGSTENYISSLQRSATAGWTYDSTTNVGTDSIAFGGMVH